MRSPIVDGGCHAGPHGTGPRGFDPDDHDLADRFVGVTEAPGGCVLIQPTFYRLGMPGVLGARRHAYGHLRRVLA
ncbi:hypothetical protein [Streptomyces sp. SD15]